MTDVSCLFSRRNLDKDMTITFGHKPLLRRMMVKKVIDPKLSLSERAEWLKWLNDHEFKNLSELGNEFTIELSLMLNGHSCESEPILAVLSRLNSGLLFAEFDHPLPLMPGEDPDFSKSRAMMLNHEWICGFFSKAHYIPESHQLFVQIKPAGLYGPEMQKLFMEDPSKYKFGMRAIQDPETKEVKRIITWDFILNQHK